MSGYRDLLVDLTRQSLRDPQGAARRLIALDPPMEARWLALLLVSVLAVLETRLALLGMSADDYGGVFGIVANPWLGVPAQALSLLTIAVAITWMGRLFGGRGTFSDALLLVAWLEFLLTLAQAVQMVVMIALPPLGALVALGVMGAFLWLMAQFIATLHGFRSLLKVFLGMGVGFASIVVFLALLFAALGIVVAV